MAKGRRFIFRDVFFIGLLLLPITALTQPEERGVTISNVGLGWAQNSINSVVFRHNALATHKHTQYIAFYNKDGEVVLGKRPTGTNEWEVEITPFNGNKKDAHNAISIMTDGDGYLHMAWDHHNSPLRYSRSIEPGSLVMSEKMPMTGDKEQRVTYPEFYRFPNGDLLFLYRDGSSGNGNLMLNYYHTKEQRWSRLQDGLIDGEGKRNAYWQAHIDQQGTIHLSWVWRETGNVETNHDICYARSRDNGVTWEKSSGEAYQLPITLATAERVVEIPQKSELINTTSMTADHLGRPYIVTYWRDSAAVVPQYRLVYHAEGSWHVRQLTNRETAFTLSGSGTKSIPISRPQVLIHPKRGKVRVLVIYRDAERGNKVTVLMNKNPDLTAWETFDLTNRSVGAWEPSYDTELWSRRGILNLFVQNTAQGDAETLGDMQPQQVNVLQWTPKWHINAARSSRAALSDHRTDQARINNLMRKVIAWQNEFYKKDNYARWLTIEWVYATYYVGLYKAALALDGDRYLADVYRYAEQAEWKVGEGKRRFFADDYLIGDLYCQLYARHQNPMMIADFRQMADELLARKSNESLELNTKTMNVFRVWAWCDAMFMGPPSLHALADVTKENKYRELADSLFWESYDYLFDKEAHLYYRDSRFFNFREENGQKQFWSRGNGWVMAGVVRILEALPSDYPTRHRYEALFKEMAEKIATLQQEDGMWRSSLLAPELYPGKETSGTGFYCYALAWGINQGLLKRKKFRPVVQKAWAALEAAVHPNGKLGFVQKIGDQPEPATYEDTDGFGVGAFLLAGTEMLRLNLK